jgi:hypothetical protein
MSQCLATWPTRLQAALTIGACNVAAATGGTSATVTITNTTGWITIDANMSAVIAITTTITKAAATGSLLTTNAVAGGDALNSREVSINAALSINAAHLWVGDITETGLGILVNAGRKSVETEVRWEVPIFVLVAKGIDVRLEGGNCYNSR